MIKQNQLIKTRAITHLLIALLSICAATAAMAKPPDGNPPITIDANVINTPLDVNVVDTTRPSPIQVHVSEICSSNACTVELYTVPEGKRLMIEYISVYAQLLPLGNAGGDAEVSIFTEFDEMQQIIVVGTTTNTGPGINSKDVYAGTAKIYAQSGAIVRCHVNPPNFQLFDLFDCGITGLLEDAN